MTNQSKGLILTTFGALLIVPDALFARLIDADALVIAFWRMGGAGLLVLLFVLLTQGVGAIRAVLGTGIYGAIYILTAGACGVMFIIAVHWTSVANVVFIIASMPVFATLYSRVFLGEPISRRMVWTMAAVTLGVGCIAYGSGEVAGAHWSGDLMALALSAAFAAGLTAVRKVRNVSMIPALALGYLATALLLLLVIDPFSVPRGDAPLVGMHMTFIAGSAALLATGPRYITSAEVALLILLETVMAPLLVWAVLDENPGVWALVGGAVVVGALLVSNMIALSRRRAVRIPR